MTHEPHPGVARPAFLVLVPNYILKIRIRLLRQEPLNEVSRFIGSESEEDPNFIHVSRVEPYGMPRLRCAIPELEEIIRLLWRWRASNFACSLQAKQQQIDDQAVELEHEGRELQTTNQAVRICVVHILIIQLNIVFRSDVIGQIVIHDKSQ